jgi:flagellar basal-body rod protein FlgG
MNDALYIAATGMQTQQLAVDTIANNMANASTPGFKSGRVNFQELMYRDAVAPAAAPTSDLQAASPPLDQGSGVGVASLLRNFAAGNLSATNNPMDLAVKGDGFLEVQMADGSTAYWRGGRIQVTSDGWLATAQGQILKPQIRVDKDIANLTISADGQVTAHKNSGQDITLGQLQLRVFPNPTGLHPLGNALYQSTDASGDPLMVDAADGSQSALAQGYAEQSNVNLVDEMVNLMMAQRAYEMNVKVIQAADEMVGMSNNLRR